MAQNIGAYNAQQIGHIHEICNPGPPAETAMDDHNNAVGVMLGSSGSGDCTSGCLTALSMGMLVVIGP